MSMFEPKDESELYSAEEIETNKAVCIIGYFGFLFFIPLVAAPNSGYAKFHANQGLLLFILGGVISALASILNACAAMPAIGFVFNVCAITLSSLGGLLTFVLLIIGIINVVQGRAKELPVIGGIRILK